MGMNNIEQIINSLFHIFDRCDDEDDDDDDDDDD